MNMDELKDLGAVQGALESMGAAITQIRILFSGQNNLAQNKTDIGSAWQSENATDFLRQYDNLISAIAKVDESLKNYRQRLDNVVSKFQGFDNTINVA